MKLRKRLLLIIGIVCGVFALLLGIVLLPAVQKAIVLKFAQQPGTTLDAARIAAGFGGADVQKVTYTMPGVVVRLDSAKIDTSLFGLLFGDTLNVSRVEVRGLVVDLTAADSTPEPPPPADTGPIAPEGFLRLADLPKALNVETISADGMLILPGMGAARPATFTIASGGIKPDAESQIECTIHLPPAANMPSGEAKIIIKIRQTADGHISALTVTANAQASVPEQPAIALNADAQLRAEGDHEVWSVRVVPDLGTEPILDASGTFAPQTQTFTGEARLLAAAKTIAPWLPKNFPTLTAQGNAAVTFNLATSDWDVRGTFDSTASSLTTFDSRLGALEPLKVHADVAARSAGGAVRTESFVATVASRDNQPLLDARLLRPLALAADGMPDRTSLEGGPIAQVALRGIPLSLAQPFLPEGFQLSGGAVTGEFGISAQSDALVFETTQPLAIPNLAAAMPDLPLAAGSDLSAKFRARLELTANRATCEMLEVALTPAAGVTASTPSLALALTRPLAFDLSAGAVLWPQTPSPIANVNLRGVPVALVQPFLPDGFEISGGNLTGELNVSAQGEMLTLATAKPFAIPNLRAALPGKPLLSDSDVSWSTTARLNLAANRATCESLELQLTATGSTSSVLNIALAQPVTIDLAAGTPVLPQNDADLARVTLDGFQLPDVSAFVMDLALSPSPQVSGTLTVKATKDGGWIVATTKQIVFTPTSLAFVGEPILEQTAIAADFDARLVGDVVTISRAGLELTNNGGRSLLAEFTGEANLATKVVPRFTFKSSGDLGRLLAQPVARKYTSITGGTFSVTAEGSATPAITAKGRFAMDNVTAPSFGTDQGRLASDFDLKSSADFLTFSGTESLDWAVGNRVSSVVATTSTSAQPDGHIAFEAKATGDYANLDDLLAFMSAGSPTTPATAPTMTPAPAPKSTRPAAGPSNQPATPVPAVVTPTTAPAVPDAKPFWSLYSGSVAANVKRGVYQGNELTDIVADITIAPEIITVRRAALKLAGSPLEAQGTVQFNAAQRESPYVVQGSAKGENVDTAALFKMISPNDPPMVATTANLDATANGTAPSLDRLAEGMNTNVKLVGNKGETRLFAAKSELTTTIGKLTGSGLPALLGLFGGRGNEQGDDGKGNLLTYAQQAGQIIEFLGSTPFDRFELEASSQGMSQLAINKLSFTSALVDIAGKGAARVPPGASWKSLAYQLQLDRFGMSGEVGKLLGKLAEVVPPKEGEAFVYLAKPVPLSGDLSRSDSSKLWLMLLAEASSMFGLR